MTQEYKIRDGTSWDARTSNEVIDVLEKARRNHTRLHLSLGYAKQDAGENSLGDQVLGLDWLDEHESCGYIGRSTGSIKVPLLICNKRSLGGPALLDHCIVRIRASRGGRVLWQHPNYQHGKITIHHKPIPEEWGSGVLTVEVRRDGEEQESFKDIASAQRYVTKMGLKAELVYNSETALA